MTDATAGQNAEQELDRITNRIIQLCDDALAQGRPYLVSRLGLDLGRDVQNLKILTDKKLVEFIRSHEVLKKRYTVVPVEGRQNVLVVVRAKDETPAIEAHEVEPRSEPRYHYRFWAAFAVPSNGQSRFIDPTRFIFKTFSEKDVVPSHWIPIEEDLIAPEKCENRDDVIKGNINAWLTKHNIDKSRFLHNARPVQMAQKSLLLSVIEALDRRQLQSTSMTLDVIATLLGKKLLCTPSLFLLDCRPGEAILEPFLRAALFQMAI